MIELARRVTTKAPPADARQRAMIDYLRTMVVCGPDGGERFHAVFLDDYRGYVGDGPMGNGHTGGLTLRMRELFAKALALGASGLVIAHNHPSGLCRPSGSDVAATRRLAEVAGALDIELIDHLIFTQDAVYSMRAGGLL